MAAIYLDFAQKITQGYPILIESGIFNDAECINRYIPQRQVCIVSNDTVAPLYLHKIKTALQEKTVIDCILPDGESFKNLAQYERILDVLIENRFGRDSVVVALGGGVVGDLAGFAAASYQRGVAFVQLPTTLLAQVDASVGGKTGVNHRLGKNMIGAFYQPQAVLIDIDVLQTLPEREFSAGLAEVIKYGLINDLPFFEWLEENIVAIMAMEPVALSQAIMHCCQNKAEIVRADEHEKGQRALLNLGHTFGHALETLSQYKRWKHGEAVAIGIRMAAELACMQAMLGREDVARIVTLFRKAKLPVNMDGAFSPQAVYEAMFADKKVRNGQLHLVVFSALGECRLANDITKAEILAAIRAGEVN